ncbi:MAG: exonuclease SbcCD subunit D [Muribaculaceae bacterium]|nr:exonuclease SbcCD subunit D [Muribaculaceae bacterium]
MFKFIHTSDWHLGQNFYGYDRSEEQRDFLRQLADIVRKQQPDALLVSGDIFHTAAPSNAAANIYVEGMLNIHKAYPDMSIIVIAGNHDSASRLDSDKRLWELAKVTVLGGIVRDTDGKANLRSHIIPVGDQGIVAAVPFAYPSSFPIVDGNETERDRRQEVYFQALLNQANANNPNGLPIVLIAHLAVNNSDFTGHDRNMTMECVELSTLGKGYDYAALGHIHRPQDVSERARYCGTPLPVSFDEQCEHSVSIVTIESHGAAPVIETKTIKNLKPLHTIPPREPADFETALEQLQQFDADKQAYIRLNVQVERFLPVGALERAAEAVKSKQCRFCEIKKTATLATTRQASQLTVEQFYRSQPIDIANQYFIEVTGKPMSDQQQKMFNDIYQSVKEKNRQ